MKVKKRPNDNQMLCTICHGSGEYLKNVSPAHDGVCPLCAGVGWLEKPEKPKEGICK